MSDATAVRRRPGANRPRAGGLWLAAALGLVLSAHVSGLFGPFLWDDEPLFDSVSRLPAGVTAIRRVFTQPFFDWWGCYYRPMTTLSFLAGERLFGENPVPQHVANLLGHLLNVTLLFFLVRRESSSRVAALTAALWGVLPRLTESTTWISGRTDVFAATAVFAALLLWGGTPVRRWGAALLLFVGLLFKEVAIAAVPVLILREALGPSAFPRTGQKAARLVPLALAVALYGALRYHVLIAQYFRDGIRPLHRLRLCFESLGTYAVMTFDAFRPRLFIGNKYESRPDLAVLGVVVAVCLIALFLRSARAGRTGVAEGLALAGAAVAPVVHLVPLPIAMRAADRFLYIPLAGVAMAVAAGSGAWSGTNRRIAAALALLLAPSLAAATAARCSTYDDEVDFWREAIRTAPRSLSTPKLYFADLLLRNGRVFEAIQLHRRIDADSRGASAVAPRLAFNDSVWMGISLAREGKDEEAIRVLERLLKEDPTSRLVNKNLLLLYLRRGNIPAARSAAGRLAGQVGAAERDDAFALIEEVARQQADSRVDVSRTTEERTRQARLLGRLGGPRARAAWLTEVDAPDASEETLTEAARWLLVEGTLEEASRAVERLRLRAPNGSAVARLSAGLEERREREHKLDAAIQELHLAAAAGPS